MKTKKIITMLMLLGSLMAISIGLIMPGNVGSLILGFAFGSMFSTLAFDAAWGMQQV